MKQVLQSLKTGATDVADVPAPGVAPGALLIRTSRTLISAGTERMLVEFGKASLLDKARRQPDKVRMVFDRIRTDGVLPTLASVRHKLDQPVALGYCNVGVVVGVGAGTTGFAVGDRVASNGKHADVVAVPANLCARVPDDVPDEAAAFTVLGAIALQGIRLAQPTLGEAVVVTGLGLVGLLAVQLLRAQGCRVLGLDFDAGRLALARRAGAETVDLSAGQDPVQAAMNFSRGRGVDAVLITAATPSDEPMHQAALMSRQRGRIVLVGVTGLDLVRDDFYRKELTFQVSSSYGPGRYDPDYEERGQDYPVGFVRWTAQRNFEAVLDMMSGGRLDTNALVSHRFAVADAAAAYGLVSGTTPSLGILLEYAAREPESTRTVSVGTRAEPVAPGTMVASVVGAGNYATAVLIPAFRIAGAALHSIASNGGVSGMHAARKFGFARTTTEADTLVADAAANTIVIATRHDTHSRFVLRALRAGKNVFVEKPLCRTLDELAEIETTYGAMAGQHTSPRLMIGFNRRFAPLVTRVRDLLDRTPGPKSFVVTVNAGALPPDHWTRDPEVGGGRIVGEACHFVDLLRFLAAAPIVEHRASFMGGHDRDTATLLLSFADGSIGAIHYFTNGSRRFAKERVEVFASGRILQLDNYRKLTGFGWPGFGSTTTWKQDKGQRACVAAFVRSVEEGTPSPIPFGEIVEVSRVTIELGQMLA